MTPEVIDLFNILWKVVERGEIAPYEQFLLFSAIFCYLLLHLYVKTGTRFSLGDKPLLEIIKVKITRVDCIVVINGSAFQGISNEYPQHTFLWRNKKNIMWIFPLIWSYDMIPLG